MPEVHDDTTWARPGTTKGDGKGKAGTTASWQAKAEAEKKEKGAEYGGWEWKGVDEGWAAPPPWPPYHKNQEWATKIADSTDSSGNYKAPGKAPPACMQGTNSMQPQA